MNFYIIIQPVSLSSFTAFASGYFPSVDDQADVVNLVDGDALTYTSITTNNGLAVTEWTVYFPSLIWFTAVKVWNRGSECEIGQEATCGEFLLN